MRQGAQAPSPYMAEVFGRPAAPIPGPRLDLCATMKRIFGSPAVEDPLHNRAHRDLTQRLVN
jgi:hypothetical protein